jgi:hypothetical protein
MKGSIDQGVGILDRTLQGISPTDAASDFAAWIFLSKMGTMGIVALVMLHLTHGAIVGAMFGTVAYTRPHAAALGWRFAGTTSALCG